ncbi:hypothetical protein [Pseudescherichia vulneris]|uniref:hypothetical protein n=1 Tax=Pseudescherichia vulneris TaxID=566 RepID=UPI001EE0AF8C|nr:hypothetical protein [Pseudescherichia vulneris]
MGDSALNLSDADWYDVVRRTDGTVMCSFPAGDRFLVYRSGGLISMRPLLDEEIIFTPNAVVQFLTGLGYRIDGPSDNMISSV